MVTVADPEGFPVNLMYGQKLAERGPVPEILTTNYEFEKPRVARFQRFKPGPAAVHKVRYFHGPFAGGCKSSPRTNNLRMQLGHYGLCVQQYETQLKWYTSTFNLAPTDFLYINPDPTNPAIRKDVATFLHIDLGQDYTDHHTFFMSQNPTAHVHHCSFEVHDFDAQNLGHEWLANKGYKSVWGVGRHILGSQIFDYWWDTTGNMIEHYADGDLVNEDTPVGWGQAGDESLAVWGPEVPKWFLD